MGGARPDAAPAAVPREGHDLPLYHTAVDDRPLRRPGGRAGAGPADSMGTDHPGTTGAGTLRSGHPVEQRGPPAGRNTLADRAGDPAPADTHSRAPASSGVTGDDRDAGGALLHLRLAPHHSTPRAAQDDSGADPPDRDGNLSKGRQYNAYSVFCGPGERISHPVPPSIKRDRLISPKS